MSLIEKLPWKSTQEVGELVDGATGDEMMHITLLIIGHSYTRGIYVSQCDRGIMVSGHCD